MSAVSLASTGTNTEDKQSEIGIFENKELNHALGAGEYAPDEILVKFKSYVGEDAINTMNSECGTSVKSTLRLGSKVLNVPVGKTVNEMVSIYASLPEVEYAEPNYVVHAFMIPNDPLYSYQWHLDNDEYGGINMESVWDISTGTGVVVAVLDTGVAYEDYDIYCQALDLAGTTFVQGYDYANGDAHPNDDQGHGTHVTGTIAQTTNNGVGVAGVAFNCSIMPVKVLDAEGSGTHSEIANGIYYAANNSADVISMSLGGSSTSQTLESAVAYAYNQGVTIVASAGNEYEEGNPTNYPAAYDDYVIAVGATRYDETRSYYSNTGSYLDIAAPGGDTSVDQNEDSYYDGVLQQTFSGGDPCNFGYWFYQGTSMAAPHVSGVAALLIANGVTGPDNVRNRLQSTAEDKGTSGWDEEYGWGLVDAEAALGLGENHPPYKPSNPSPSDGATNVATNTLLSWSGGDPDGDTVNYDVYLGTTTAPSLVSSVSTTSYNPSLNPNTHYYWKINATDSHGASNTSELLEFTTGAGAVDANWTFMVYLDGDNNLEPDGIDDMNEMEVVGSTSNVNIIVQFDRIPGYDSTNGDWTGTRRYYVTQDVDTATIGSTLIQDLGEVDMADPNVLVSFVEWAMQNYSASNYALILWNHGSGWKYQGGKWVPWADSEIPIRLKEDEKRTKDPIKGIIYDDTSGTHLSMSELKQALNTIKTDTGKNIDVLGFDACLMQMIEVAYQVKDYSDVMVGSEETEPGDGWPYDTILSNLTANPLMAPSGLGSEIVADYIASCGTSGDETQSAANQTKLSNLVSAVDNFAQVLNASLSSYSSEVIYARLQTESYYDADYIDLYHFAELINASISDNTVKTAATAVMNNITNTIFAEAHGSGHPNSHGLTIYFPLSQSDYLTSYGSIDFANDTKWDEFLNGFYFYSNGSSVIVPDANILLVDDDLGSLYEVYYKAALDANGYNYSYWNIANDESPNTTILSDHSIVIWFTGDDSSTTLESTDQTNLQTYLNAGGNLFISGQDIGYNLVDWGDVASQSFYKDYLHAQYVEDDSGITTLNGVSGDPIGDGLTIGISGGDGANNQNWPSKISPKDAYTSYVFNYTGDGCGAIKANTTHKVVYVAFGFEAINSSADRNTVMGRVISWFGGAEAGVPDIGVNPTSFNVTLPQNTVSNETLIIGNNGDETLTYSITSGVDWLSESPTSGTVNPSNQTNITITINTTGLSVGEYYANITIANNDPDENPVIIPVNLTVLPTGLLCNILFDETHEPSGNAPGYFTIEDAYSEWAALLESRGMTVDSITSGPITYDVLKNYGMVVIPQSTENYTNAEIDALKQYVNDGGGLLILGEFGAFATQQGIYPVVNEIAAEFGMAFNDDMVNDPTHNEGMDYWPIIPDFDNSVVGGDVSDVVEYAACSIGTEAEGSAFPIAWAYGNAYVSSASAKSTINIDATGTNINIEGFEEGSTSVNINEPSANAVDPSIIPGTATSQLDVLDIPDSGRVESAKIAASNVTSYIFTVADVIFFSYENGTNFTLYNSAGSLLWSGSLDKGEHHHETVSIGVYRAVGSKPFSVLTGDPITRSVCGYYAMDQNSYGASTELYTWVPSHEWTGEKFIIFAYEDSTQVTLSYTDTGAVIWSGTLNKGQHHEETGIYSKFLHVESSKPVSALTCFDQGYFVPSASKTFSGCRFYTYVGKVGGWWQDLTVMAYKDNTYVTIQNTSTGAVIWSGNLNSGQAHVESFQNVEKYLTITSENPVTVSVQPWVKFTSTYHQGAYMQDSTGAGIGTDLIGATLSGGYLYIFAYENGTSVSIYNSQTGALVSSHTLNKGDYVEANPGNGLWRIKSSRPVSSYSGYGTWNADFAPVEFGEVPTKLQVTVDPDTVSVDVITSVDVLVEDFGLPVENAFVVLDGCGLSKSGYTGSTGTVTFNIYPTVEGVINVTATKGAKTGTAEIHAYEEGPVVMAASTYGSGRAMVIGDGNLFSNGDPDSDSTINLYEYDNEKLAVNIIDWLCKSVVEQPDIWVDPTSFNVTLNQGNTWSNILKIGNDGNATLTYNLTDNSSWLDESPKTGLVEPSSWDDIVVSIDTTGLNVGKYSANIIMDNNDPDENPTIVPVNLTVCEPEPFDTGSPENPYSSLFGTHNGTITPNQTITVSKLYTHPCAGTGGHSEYVAFYNATTGEEIANGTWTGYQGAGDYHYIVFEKSFRLEKDVTYNYTIRTGSYPQIHHTSALPTANGWINCTEFTDANGKEYTDWIPAIRLV